MENNSLPLLSPSTTSRDRATDQGAQARGLGARPRDRLLELLAPLDPARHVSYLEGVERALAGYDDHQITHAVTRIAELGAVAINPVGLLVDRANNRDPLHFPPSTPAGPAAPDDEAIQELPDLWGPGATGPEPDGDRIEALPEFDPDATLAARLAARAAYEAARQPVTPDELAARQAASGGPGVDAGDGRPDREENAA